MLTAERLRELLDYDPATGEFRWRKCDGKPSVVGKPAGWIENGRGKQYLRIMVDGKSYLAQRLAVLYVTGRMPTKSIDHKDTDSLNNRFENLREATQSQNSANRGPTVRCKSGYKGVFWYKKTKKWVAYIRYDYKLKNLGYYKTPEEAAAAYEKAAAEIFGEFARTT